MFPATLQLLISKFVNAKTLITAALNTICSIDRRTVQLQADKSAFSLILIIQCENANKNADVLLMGNYFY